MATKKAYHAANKQYYSDASRRWAEQTRKRARRKQREKERERLTRLGVDADWLARVLPDD